MRSHLIGRSGDYHLYMADATITRESLLEQIRLGKPVNITYAQRHLMPRRSAFCDPSLRPIFAQTIKRRQPIIFMPNTVHDKIDWTDGAKHRSYVFGVLPCGSKTCVVIDGIEVNYRLRVPDDTTDGEFTAVLRAQMASSLVDHSTMTTVKLLPMRGFRTEPVPYKHITFRNTMERRKFSDMVANMNALRRGAGRLEIETANDDTGTGNFYYNKAAREHRFNTANWNRLDKYEVLGPDVTTNCAYTLRTHVNDYKRLSRERRSALTKKSCRLADVIDRDPMMVASWDIETWTPIQNGVIPSATDMHFIIKMICTAYFPQHSDKSHLRVCCTMHPANTRDGVDVTIHCATERELLDAHSEIWGYMAPDIAVATNGSNFDWPLVREKMRRYGQLVTLKQRFSSLPLVYKGNYADTEENVQKWSFRSEKIKIDATTDALLDTVAGFPGLLDTDLTPVFTKLYPRNEVRKAASLNFFLESNGLESKADMPYRRMAKIFERAEALKAAPTVCHCATQCALCAECVKDVDCKSIGDDMYSAERLDPPGCCFCTKRPRNLADMAEVGYYCVIDCVRPQQLYVKRMIVGDKRGLASLSYTQLYDAFYRADGMKVANLIGAHCHKRGIAFSNVNRNVRDCDKDFYPGAWVFPPNRGLHSDGWMDIVDQAGNKRRVRCRPTVGLDFASLYPSLMMTYNLSPDKVVYTFEEAQRLAAAGYLIHHIKPFTFERGTKKGAAGNRKLSAEGWIVRHRGIVNTERDKKTVDGYKKQWKQADGSVTDVGPGVAEYVPIYGREPLPGEDMGIFPFVVKKIFDKRVPIKKKFLYWQGLEEAMSKDGLAKITVDIDGVPTELDYDADVCFQKDKVDTEQRALKVLANTFYGKSGEYRASIYELLVAAGVTCAGQQNIKMVAQFLESLGYIVHYGDTDSVYISCPDTIFADCDREYDDTIAAVHAKYAGVPNVPTPQGGAEADYKAERISARIRWWTAQVRATQKDIDRLKPMVSEMLMRDNGTRSLNMAYEEVGMPSVYCGKKKYYMTPHVEDVNFYPKKPFIRGIDIVKQGQAKITKVLGDDFIRESLSPENELSLMDICLNKIAKFGAMSHDVTMFAQSARYKPTVNNVPVKVFVARMVEQHKRYTDAGDHAMAALYEPPEPGDKFEYVVVSRDQRFTISGTKISLKKGDRMEYLRVYNASQSGAEPLRLDLDHYMSKAIVGLFARFICYHADFQPKGEYDFCDKDQYTAFDKECLKAASKYLLGHNSSGVSAAAMTVIGRGYQAVYKHAKKRMRADLGERIGGAGIVLHGLSIGDSGASLSKQIVDQIGAMANDIIADRECVPSLVSTMRARGNVDIFALRTYYSGPKGIGKARVRELGLRARAVIDKMYSIARPVADLMTRYNTSVAAVIEDMRRDTSDDITLDDNELSVLHAFTDDDIELMRRMHEHMVQLIAIKTVMADTEARMIDIESERANSVGGRITPTINRHALAATAAKAAVAIDEYAWA